MNGLSLNNKDALKALMKNKDQCLFAFRSLAVAAVTKGGRLSLYINGKGEIFVTETKSNNNKTENSNGDLCIYIADSMYQKQIALLIQNDDVWEKIFKKVADNLEREGIYEPYVLCADASDVGLVAEAIKGIRESEKNELKIYTPEQIFTKAQIEYVFKETGMINSAKDEYRKNAFSFDYISREKVSFDGDRSADFWSLFLSPDTSFFIYELTDKSPGVEFEFGYIIGGEQYDEQ